MLSIIHKDDEAKIWPVLRQATDSELDRNLEYADQFCETVGIVVSTSCSLIIRYRYGLDLNAGILVVSFVVQLLLEITGDVIFLFWEGTMLGYRKRVAQWREHLASNSYLSAAFLAVLATPLFTSLWIQCAVLGVPE